MYEKLVCSPWFSTLELWNHFHTEVCFTFLRLKTVLSESANNFWGQNIKIQCRTSFDLHNLERPKCKCQKNYHATILFLTYLVANYSFGFFVQYCLGLARSSRWLCICLVKSILKFEWIKLQFQSRRKFSLSRSNTPETLPTEAWLTFFLNFYLSFD